MEKTVESQLLQYPQDVRARSWNRRLSRRILQPFAGTFLRPGYITTMRIATGLGSCAALAQSETIWGGFLWIVSAFLDRCDGEFARMKGMATRSGRIYDFMGDVFINTMVFPAIGIGLSNTDTDPQILMLSVIAAAGVATAAVAAEINENGMAHSMKSFNCWFGLEFDDLVYLIAPFVWFGALYPLLIGAAVGGPLVAAAIILKLVHKLVN